MTIYLDAKGREVVVCDGCGITHDGTKPDLATLTKKNLTAGLQEDLVSMGVAAADAKQAELNVTDLCPACNGPDNRGL